MATYLVKTDPDTYAVADFEKEGTTIWDGVHNNAALLFMKAMKPGDMVYVYESLSTKAILATATVIDEPRPNPDDPRRSTIVTLRFEKRTRPVTLAEIKNEPSLKDFALVRQSRLSVMPVPDEVAEWIEKHF